MSARSQISENEGLKRLLRPAAVGVVAGVLMSAAILALMSFIMSVSTVPQAALDPLAVFAMSAGAFSAGFCCAKIVHKNGLGCGLFTGLVFALVMLVCSFAAPGGGLGLGALLKALIVIFSSMLGGVLGVNTKNSKKPVK